MSRMEVWTALYETFLSQKRHSCRSWPVVIAKNRLYVPVPLERGLQRGRRAFPALSPRLNPIERLWRDGQEQLADTVAQTLDD